MSLRTRILLASALLVLLPLAILASGIRQEMNRRLTDQYRRRVETLVKIIEDDLDHRNRSLADRLAALKSEMAADNRLRMALAAGPAGDRTHLLDFAGRAMSLTGLSMMQIEDAEGRILSSGHFRNEYDRFEPALPRLLAAAPGGMALIQARRPEGTFLALARSDSLWLGGRRLTLIAGIAVDRELLSGLARGQDVAVTLISPQSVLSTDAEIEMLLAGGGALDRNHLVRTLELPMALLEAPGVKAMASSGTAEAGMGTARLMVSHSLAPLQELLGSLDRWLVLVLGATAAGTLAVAVGLAARIGQPLRALAEKTAAIDLDRLDADFSSSRTDEVGRLSRFLAAMTERLRRSVERLREAERRAALGELARQVNHDLRNGVAPIRHVLRHLGQIARERPLELGAVFLERQATLETSLAYLEELAANYARLSPLLKREPVQVNDVVRQAASSAATARINLRLELSPSLPEVIADPVALRRIIENLIRNARESLAERQGTITLSTGRAAGEKGEARVMLTVADTGSGMGPAELERIFDDFYTTKEGGTGLGLSIVRRLVSDFGGTVSVESEPGRGTRFTLSLPAGGASSS